MKNYVLVLIFSTDFNKILLVKRNKNPYANCWNGIGGKINPGEHPMDAAYRECKEETNIDLKDPKLLMTMEYPEDTKFLLSNNMRMSVVYSNNTMVKILPNDEGKYSWKPVEFAMDFNSKEIAGYSNLAQMIKEIRANEGIDNFY